jgi:uncharacterized protein YggE
MKNTVPVMIAILAFALPCASAPEVAGSPPRTVSVSGTAVAHVPVDTVVWTITMDSSGKDLREAKEASDRQVKSLLATCEQKGIQGQDIDIGKIRIADSRTSDSRPAYASRPLFRITRVITLRQSELRHFTSLLELLSRGDRMRVRYRIVSSKVDEIRRETLVKATKAARTKAAAMVEALGGQLGKALKIDEYPPSDQHASDQNTTMDQDSAAFGADAEKLTTTVFVTFEIQ